MALRHRDVPTELNRAWMAMSSPTRFNVLHPRIAPKLIEMNCCVRLAIKAWCA